MSLDDESRRILEDRAAAAQLSLSAFLRVMARVLREPISLEERVVDVRQRIADIILEEAGEVRNRYAHKSSAQKEPNP